MMRPRAIYGRVSFWLGLFVACFIVWAWWDSMHFRVDLGLGPKGPKLGLCRQEGVSFILKGLNLGVGFRHEKIERFKYEQGGGNLEGLERDLDGLAGAGLSYVRVRDEVVLAGWLVVWGGWMAGMRWRERRVMGDG